MTAWESRGPVEAKPDLSAISSTRKSATYAAALKTLDKLEEKLHIGDDYLIMATDYPHADAARSLLNVRSETSPKIPTCLRRPGERSCGRCQKRSEPPSTNTRVELNS